ncbi:uncharacterized protein TRUGW13939_04200 [Talaromyces rugulosus]|uniref:Glycosyl transferase n=1 Tax=Talaromyces rugulosus TaxID=121627 RepID=A0A7H8QT15_TALRU|nr:uncharacterized protein TRUGW13939_04200 [Talaromyces rugulosus]QKX57092.1 hypothetical protein TRUGW13939_04200 [Talaromyces rugulosus]
MGLMGVFRRRWQRLAIVSIIFCMVSLSIVSSREDNHDVQPHSDLEAKHPLLYKHIHMSDVKGGAFYIPPTWTSASDPKPTTIIEAARLLSRVIDTSTDQFISRSEIPLIVHQTWKNTQVDTWPELVSDSVEIWLEHAVSTPMAYLLWDDEGIYRFLEEYEPRFIDQFSALPRMVEKSDVFRIMVSKYIGGIYGDVDTHPLRSPATWIGRNDLEPWDDPVTGSHYNSTKPVRAIFGIEADCPPETDDYWRMGYTNPVQLTQWALATAPGHPVLSRFMDRLHAYLDEVAVHHEGNLTTSAASQELYYADPLVLTGPSAITEVTQDWLEDRVGLRWNALTGLYDGGRSKLVDDIMILPITGFSPGRGPYGNMGSKPLNDPDARLQHLAQGSWKGFNLRVEMGKFCRTFLGLCKDWSKT